LPFHSRCRIDKPHLFYDVAHLSFIRLASDSLLVRGVVGNVRHNDSGLGLHSSPMNFVVQLIPLVSSSILVVRQTRLATVNDWSFPVAASRVRNNLPQHVITSPSHRVFESCLKTNLFSFSSPRSLYSFLQCACEVTVVILDTLIVINILIIIFADCELTKRRVTLYFTYLLYYTRGVHQILSTSVKYEHLLQRFSYYTSITKALRYARSVLNGITQSYLPPKRYIMYPQGQSQAWSWFPSAIFKSSHPLFTGCYSSHRPENTVACVKLESAAFGVEPLPLVSEASVCYHPVTGCDKCVCVCPCVRVCVSR